MKSHTNYIRFFTTIVLAILFNFISHVTSESENDNTSSRQQHPQSEKLILYLVAIPESSIANLQRLRQDDEDISSRPSFAQTGEHLGQIIQGVLGGDLRPVFSGSLGFVEEPMAQQNLGSFLGTIAPALNLALREIYTRAQATFGFGMTTTKPTQSANATAATAQEPLSSPSASMSVQEDGKNKSVTAYFGQEEQQQKQSEIQQHAEPASSTTSWQYVLNQIHAETTTVEPLPLIKYRTTLSSFGFDEDGDDDDGRRRV